MNRIDRLFGILVLLQTKRYILADCIADKFEISIRTVYRDLKALVELGVPISFEAQRGYFLVKGYFLPPVSFTSEEANALLLMEGMVSAFADKSILTHYSNALNKIKVVLKGLQKDKLEIMDKNIVVQLPPRFSNDFEYLSLLQMAISAKSSIEIEYCNSSNENSKRVVEPIGLIFYAFSWHLIAWCQLRKEYRDFKISRITKIKDLQMPFSKAIHIEVNEYMKLLPVNY